jgi:hypothetical protein
MKRKLAIVIACLIALTALRPALSSEAGISGTAFALIYTEKCNDFGLTPLSPGAAITVGALVRQYLAEVTAEHKRLLAELEKASPELMQLFCIKSEAAIKKFNQANR